MKIVHFGWVKNNTISILQKAKSVSNFLNEQLKR